MLGFFPHPYPDELLYSVLARYHKRSSNNGVYNTIQELFGSRNITSNIFFATYLDSLIRNLPIGSKYSTEDLIFNNTLFPLFLPFINQLNYNILMTIFEKGNSNHQKYRLGSFGTKILQPKLFRFCPECAREDYNLYGELYWHRCHQIMASLICYKHKVLIRNSSVPFLNNKNYIAATRENCSIKPTDKFDSEYHSNPKILDQIAKDIQWLLTQRIYPRTHNWFYYAFTPLLKKAGYLSSGELIDFNELVNDFVNYYGNNLLGLLDSSINENNKNLWLYIMLHKRKRSFHPIRYILISNFLQKSISEIINSSLSIPLTKGDDSFFEDSYTRRGENNTFKKKLHVDNGNSRELLCGNHKFYSPRVNWALRDEEILAKIKEIAYELQSTSTKPIRITAAEIQKKIGSKDLKFNLDKLPKTNIYLKTIIDNTETYQIRKIYWAARILLQENKEITVNLIKWKASLRNNRVSKRVMDRIESVVEEHSGINLAAATKE